MILLTGGTGFVGRALARQLVTAGHSVRILLRPSQHTPDLPKGVPVEVAVASLSDERGLRAALRGVDTVYHLAGAEQEGGRADLMNTDIKGTETLARAASGARVRRIFYVSHLGADRASAFPVLKAKGIAEEYIRQGDVPYTILRSGILFGPEDHFTTGLARLLHLSPVLFVPPRNDILLQPLWVEDLTRLVWSLEGRCDRQPDLRALAERPSTFAKPGFILRALARDASCCTCPALPARADRLRTELPRLPDPVF
jgi:NADH dehydrogenase